MVSCQIEGPNGCIREPDRSFSVTFFFRLPPCQQLSHLSQVFIEGRHIPSALLFLVKYPSTIQAAVSRFPLVRNTLCLPLLQNTTALISWVSKCCSPPLNPPPPAETSPPPQASPLMENQQGSQEARLNPLPFMHQNELPCTGGMVHSCQPALPL